MQTHNSSKHFTIDGKGVGVDEDENVSDAIVLKGIHPDGEVTIDMRRVRECLHNLKNNRRMRISDLHDHLLHDFRHITQIVQAANGTQAYGAIYQHIREVFGELETKTVEVATIDAYFNGCVLRTSFNGPPSCSAICAGAIPPHPDVPGWEQCQHLVLIYDNGNFITSNNVGNKSKAYIFIADNLQFKGFNDAEIKKLQAMGVQEVKIVRYSDGSSYSEEMNDFVPLNKVATNPSSTSSGSSSSSDPSSTSSNSGWGIAIIIIIVIVVLILLFLGIGVAGSQDYY